MIVPGMDKVESACHECGKSYVHPVSENMIVFCPYCRHSDIVTLDFFGSDEPCIILLGDELVGKVVREGDVYRLVSEKYSLDEELSAIYTQSAFAAGEMISRKMEEGV